MDYNYTFNKRANLYKYSIERYPNVLKNEFETAVEMCNIKEGDVLLIVISNFFIHR